MNLMRIRRWLPAAVSACLCLCGALEACAADEQDSWIENGWREGYAEVLEDRKDLIDEGLGYYFLDDMNGDGVPELGLHFNYEEDGYIWDSGGVTVYTWSTDQVLKLGDYDELTAFTDFGVIRTEYFNDEYDIYRDYRIDLSEAGVTVFLDAYVTDWIYDDDNACQVFYAADEEGNELYPLTKGEYDDNKRAYQHSSTYYTMPEYAQEFEGEYGRIVTYQQLTEDEVETVFG